MRLLLDTHVLLWYGINDPQLSGTARTLILDASNEILMSPASYWEIAIKVSIGKLALHQPYEGFVDACLNRYGFRILPIETAHTAKVATLPFPSKHKDPFDRLIVAQALAEGIGIISGDQALDVCGVNRMW